MDVGKRSAATIPAPAGVVKNSNTAAENKNTTAPLKLNGCDNLNIEIIAFLL
jgi:hypothetical protein